MEIIAFVAILVFIWWLKNRDSKGPGDSAASRRPNQTSSHQAPPPQPERGGSEEEPSLHERFDSRWEAEVPLVVFEQMICDTKASPRPEAYGSHLGKLVISKSHIMFFSLGKRSLFDRDDDTSMLGLNELANEGSLSLPLDAVMKLSRDRSLIMGHYISLVAKDSFRSQAFSFVVHDPEDKRDIELILSECVEAISYAIHDRFRQKIQMLISQRQGNSVWPDIESIQKQKISQRQQRTNSECYGS